MLARLGRTLFAIVLLAASGMALAQQPLWVQATVRQADGKILVAGTVTQSNTLALWRINADGTRDPDFAGGAMASYTPPVGSSARVGAMTVLADGRVLLAAQIDSSQFALLRFESSGALDTTFGSSTPGFVLDPGSAGLRINGLAADSAGRILAFGSYTGAETYGSPAAAVARYVAAGTRDTTFGAGPGGVRILPFYSGYESELRAVARSANGNIAAAGYISVGYRNFLVASFLPDGELDPSFAGSGWTTASVGYSENEAYGVAWDLTGNLVAVGRDGYAYNYDSRFAALKVSPQGAVMSSMSRAMPIEGRTTTAVAMSAAALIDGDIVVGGTVDDLYGSRSYYALTRMSSGETRIGPLSDNHDDNLVGVHATGDGFVVGVGFRDMWGGYATARRARYFSDDLQFDTDFEQEGYDTTPNAFAFPPVGGAALSTEVTSSAVRISGIDQPAYASVTGGTLSVGCTGAFVGSAAIANGQRICVRVTSAATGSTAVGASVDVNGVQATFNVTTAGPPETRIDSYPPDPSGSSVVFFYSGDTISGPLTGIECRIDDAPFEPCGGNHRGFIVSQGTHTFEVRASNAYGTDPTPATYTWTVAPPPDTTLTSTPPPATNSTSATFAFTSSDPNAAFQCSTSAGIWNACTSPTTLNNLTQNGTRTFSVRAWNSIGIDDTPATYSWVVDTVPPEVNMTGGPSYPVNTPTVTFTYTYRGTEATTLFDCSLDGGPWYACNGGAASVTVEPGSHNFAVRARDAAGNVDPTPESRSWSLVVSTPETTITTGPSGTITTNTAAFGYTASESASFECSLTGYNGGAWHACSSFGASYTNLADGPYTFQVRARNGAGTYDPTPATRDFTVAYVPPPPPPPPETSIVNPPAYSRDAVQFDIRSDKTGVTFECSLDAAAWAACPQFFIFNLLANGTHTIRARAVLSGQADPTPAEHTWIVDTIPPVATIQSMPGFNHPSYTVTFTFTSNEPGSTFECSLSQGAFAPCASPLTLQLANGSYMFGVRAIDLAGNVNSSQSHYGFSIWVNPDTVITSGPSGTVPQSNATFTFAADESPVTFTCSLDGGAFEACSSPRTYSGLADGAHTFQVIARNDAHPDPTPASRTWTVDTAAPVTSFTSGPSGVVNTSSATFGFASNEPGATFTCALDGGAAAACTSPVTYTGLAEGTHTLGVVATDAVGNAGAAVQRTWQVDLTSPETTVESGPTGTTAQTGATFTFSSPDATAVFQCSLDGAAFASCQSGVAYSGLAEGTHLFEVRAIDAVGNVDGSPASRTWSVDTSNPNTTISSGPAAVTSETGATFVFSATEAGTFMCRLDAGAYAACASPQSFVALPSGPHAFSVYAVDAAGNADASAATWSWAIDVTAADTTITSAPSGAVAQASAAIAFSSPEAGVGFECSLDGAPFAACASPVTLAGLAEGAHSFRVRAKDAAGNVDETPAIASWVVDTAAPDTTITAAPATASNSTSASFSFASTEGGTFECKLDSGAFTACTSPMAYTGLASGAHTFQVRSRDAAGNIDASPAAFNWTVDITAPDTTITAGPNGNNNANPVSFTFTASEAASTFECRMDATAFAACTSPASYADLAKGSHVFQVRAKDGAGNIDPSPASRNFGVK